MPPNPPPPPTVLTPEIVRAMTCDEFKAGDWDGRFTQPDSLAERAAVRDAVKERMFDCGGNIIENATGGLMAGAATIAATLGLVALGIVLVVIGARRLTNPQGG